MSLESFAALVQFSVHSATQMERVLSYVFGLLVIGLLLYGLVRSFFGRLGRGVTTSVKSDDEVMLARLFRDQGRDKPQYNSYKAEPTDFL